VQENLSKLLPEIYSHMAIEAPREGCGLIIDKENPKFIPLENISGEKDHFTIDPKEYVKYSIKSKILYVVHSHYDQDCYPSEHDKNNCKALGIPYLIVSYPDKKEFIYDPR
jgi:proteasome lid subunit RPN8/RPN11